MPAPNCLLLGRLRRDTIITADGRARIDQLGGNLLYAAAACRLWGDEAGLVARVGSDFPSEWLHDLADKGLDARGIRVLDEAHDLRRFIAYINTFTPRYDHPLSHFAKWNLPLPKELLSYSAAHAEDSKKQRAPLTLRPSDLPADYHGARVAHLCPLDYFSHSLLPPALRELGVQHVTLEGAAGYMHRGFWNEMPALLNGLSAFMVEEAVLKELFTGRDLDLWQMIEGLAFHNCAAVVVHSAARGYWMYEAANRRRVHLAPYPARTYDITDSGSSFGAAFAVNLGSSQDWQRALLAGAATASLAVEGSDPFYVMDTFPGLAVSRMELLAGALKTV